MNALWGLLIVAGIIYGIAIDATLLKIYFALVAAYLVFVLLQRRNRDNPKRKTLVISTWACKY